MIYDMYTSLNPSEYLIQASDWGTEVVQNHAWKISDIGTFASNIGVILYQCPLDPIGFQGI